MPPLAAPASAHCTGALTQHREFANSPDAATTALHKGPTSARYLTYLLHLLVMLLASPPQKVGVFDNTLTRVPTAKSGCLRWHYPARHEASTQPRRRQTKRRFAWLSPGKSRNGMGKSQESSPRPNRSGYRARR